MSVNALTYAREAARIETRAGVTSVYTEADFAGDVAKTMAFGAIAIPVLGLGAAVWSSASPLPLKEALLMLTAGLSVPALAYAIHRALRAPGSAPKVMWTLTKYVGPVMLIGVIWAVWLVNH